MRLLVTRPLPEAMATARTLRTRGHVVLVSPMLRIRRLRFAVPQTGVQAFVVTSLNGARALAGAIRPKNFAGQVYAVGPRTADAMRNAGFDNVSTPEPAGGSDVLARFIVRRARPDGGEIVHVAGEDAAGDLTGALGDAGFLARRVIAYRAEPTRGLSKPATRALARGSVDAVLLYSPRTVEAFFSCLRQPGVDGWVGETRFLCLSDAVAAMIPDDIDCGSVEIAMRPDEPALLALVDAARTAS